MENRYQTFPSLASQIITIRDLNALLDTVTRLAVEMLGAARGYLLWREPQDEVWSIQRVVPPPLQAGTSLDLNRYETWIQRAQETRSPVLVNITDTPTEAMDRTPLPPPRSLILAPLILPQSGLCIGLLLVESPAQGPPFETRDLELMESFARLAAVAIENMRLFEQATIDSLTGVYMRGFFQRRLEEEFQRSLRSGQPLVVLLCDLDDFKMVNDQYGHLMGDRVLRTFAEILKASIRKYDFVGRYGGDEFALVLPGVHLADASRRAETLRQVTQERLQERLGVMTTVSIGGVVYPIHAAETVENLLQMADAALYRAKRLGKNLVYFYQQEALLPLQDMAQEQATDRAASPLLPQTSEELARILREVAHELQSMVDLMQTAIREDEPLDTAFWTRMEPRLENLRHSTRRLVEMATQAHTDEPVVPVKKPSHS